MSVFYEQINDDDDESTQHDVYDIVYRLAQSYTAAAAELYIHSIHERTMTTNIKESYITPQRL